MKQCTLWVGLANFVAGLDMARDGTVGARGCALGVASDIFTELRLQPCLPRPASEHKLTTLLWQPVNTGKQPPHSIADHAVQVHVEEFIAAALDQRKVLNAKNIKSIFGEMQ